MHSPTQPTVSPVGGEVGAQSLERAVVPLDHIDCGDQHRHRVTVEPPLCQDVGHIVGSRQAGVPIDAGTQTHLVMLVEEQAHETVGWLVAEKVGNRRQEFLGPTAQVAGYRAEL
jgi:hypothetical protein